MATPARSASWLGLKHNSGKGGSEARPINALLDASCAPSRRQNHLRTLHIAPHSAVEGEHLTRRLFVQVQRGSVSGLR